MNEKYMDDFEERLRTRIMGEMLAAIDAGDEVKAFKIVTIVAGLLAEAIGTARLCDKEFVETATFAVCEILGGDIDHAPAHSWPRWFVSSEVVPS